MDDLSQGDICRVCRCEALTDRPLFYPCICRGSIKYIHEDCLMQWMHYSHREYCELCFHRFSFLPIYGLRVQPLRDLRMILMWLFVFFCLHVKTLRGAGPDVLERDEAPPAGAQDENNNNGNDKVAQDNYDEAAWAAENLLVLVVSRLFVVSRYLLYFGIGFVLINIMFIFIFVFCPNCVGNFILSSMNLLENPLWHFHGLITTLFDYFSIGLKWAVLHFFALIFRLRRICWFLVPDFSRIKEIIHVPIVRHVRRLVASAMIFGFTVLLLFWLPIRILQVLWPTFLSYALSIGDSEVNDLSLQLLLMQIVLPGFFDQTEPLIWLKGLVRLCCMAMGWMLGTRGRRLMMLWPGDKLPAQALDEVPPTDPKWRLWRSHELYTAEIRSLLCWFVVVTLLAQGRTAIVNKLKHCARVALQYVLPVLTLLSIFVLVPLLFGLLLELVLVIPLRVPLRKTPIHFLWQDWALGVVYAKIAITLTRLGPEWHLKRALERADADGWREFDSKFVMRDLVVPVVSTLGLALAIPYVLGNSILTMFFVDPYSRLAISRLIYPVTFHLVGNVCFVLFQIMYLKKLYLSAKVEKVVGQRLVNFEQQQA